MLCGYVYCVINACLNVSAVVVYASILSLLRHRNVRCIIASISCRLLTLILFPLLLLSRLSYRHCRGALAVALRLLHRLPLLVLVDCVQSQGQGGYGGKTTG